MSIQVLFSFKKNGLFNFLLLSCKISLHVLYTSPLLDIRFAGIFFQSCGLSFDFLDNVLGSTKVFNFDEVQFLYFFFCCWFFWYGI